MVRTRKPYVSNGRPRGPVPSGIVKPINVNVRITEAECAAIDDATIGEPRGPAIIRLALERIAMQDEELFDVPSAAGPKIVAGDIAYVSDRALRSAKRKAKP